MGGESVFLTQFIALLVLLSFIILVGSRISKKHWKNVSDRDFMRVDMDDEDS